MVLRALPMQPCDSEQIMYLQSHSALHTQAACQSSCSHIFPSSCVLELVVHLQGYWQDIRARCERLSTSAALLNRDDASIGPSEDEEASLLPDGGQGRRTTNGSLDSIFEQMESQPV